MDRIQNMLELRSEDTIPIEKIWQIPIVDSGEPLVLIYKSAPEVCISLTEKRQRFMDETLYARFSVVEALHRISIVAKNDGLLLEIWDAFRPIEFQEKEYNKIYDKTRDANPEWSEERVIQEISTLVCPPSMDYLKPPPHTTGGAIDLTLVYQSGAHLDMGTQYSQFENPLICTNALGLSKIQRKNRTTLITLMGNGGFTNHPKEWWHFELGTQGNAAYLGEQQARFGRMEDPYKDRLQEDHIVNIYLLPNPEFCAGDD